MDDGKDYILQVRVKNGPMLRAMRAAGYESTTTLSRVCGVPYQTICAFLNLKRPAMGRNDQWSAALEIVADTLGVMPGDLFPPQHYRSALKKNVAETEASLEEIGAFLPSAEGDPQKLLEWNDATDLLAKALETLNPRQRRVLELRYGLGDNDEHTLRECGREIGVSPERLRQIECKALRQLKDRARRGDVVLERLPR